MIKSSKKSPLVNTPLYFFIGTVAELIKVAPVILELKKRHQPFKIIASGQNNLATSDLWTILRLPPPDIILSRTPKNPSMLGLFFWWWRTLIQGSWFLRTELRSRKRPITLIVHGDTVSTLMGSIIGRLYGCRVAHLEAGLRSFNLLNPFPEEITRILVSYLATIHFCPNEWAVKNIVTRSGKKINTYQNTLLDSLNLVLEQPFMSLVLKKLNRGKFFIFVIHRQENVINQELMKSLMDKVVVQSKKMKCVFIIHDLTKVYLEKYGLFNVINNQPRIITTSRLRYVEMMHLLQKAEFIITDGGSNQEESYYLGKPCLILRKATERIEGLNENVLLSLLDQKNIDLFLKDYHRYQRKPVKVTVNPSHIIAHYLINKVQ